MKKKLILILIFISLTISSQTTQQLDEVVVSDSKINIPFSKNFRSIQLIDSKTIEEIGARDVTELLQLLTGIDVRRRGVSGTQADLYIRGGGFDQTLLLIDGMKSEAMIDINEVKLVYNKKEIKENDSLDLGICNFGWT